MAWARRPAGALRAGAAELRGEAIQVDPIKPKLELPGSKLLKLKCDVLLSTSALKFNLRRYKEALEHAAPFASDQCPEGVVAGAYTRSLLSST